MYRSQLSLPFLNSHISILALFDTPILPYFFGFCKNTVFGVGVLGAKLTVGFFTREHLHSLIVDLELNDKEDAET